MIFTKQLTLIVGVECCWFGAVEQCGCVKVKEDTSMIGWEWPGGEAKEASSLNAFSDFR